MEFQVITGDIARTEAAAIMVNCFEHQAAPQDDAARIDAALDGAISSLIREGEVRGKLNEVTMVHTLGKLPAARVVILGLGKQEELTAVKVRGAVAEACRWLRARGISDVATVPHGAGKKDISSRDSAQAITEGALLGLYAFRKHKTKDENGSRDIKQLTIVGGDGNRAGLEEGVRKGIILAEAANLARDMVNEPANHMTPTHMAKMAVRIAGEHGLNVTVLDRDQIQEMGMGGLLGVSQGSRQPPKFIILRYKGSDSTETHMALVGKAITFDSGGISIKPSEKLEEMKGDMAGGAATMAAIGAIAQLKPPVNVLAVIPATENLPDGNALKPGDVLTAMNGKTMEIISTDAEGRLVLADALSYAVREGARYIIDAATLTGACRIALGDICTGAFANNQELVDRVIAAGKEAGEMVWQMPMYDEYREQNKSDVADVKNVGGRLAGAITAAKFLSEFVDSVPWVHLDIAGTSMTDKDRGIQVKGATGVPVRTMVNAVLSLAADAAR